MTYILLNNEKGIITSRQPEVCRGELQFEFQNAPDGAVAVFDGGRRTYFRELDTGTCAAPLTEGTFRVTVAVMDGTLAGARWICEGIRCEALSSGELFVSPDDTDFPKKIADLALECDSLRSRVTAAEDAIAALKERLEHLMEGYDIT